MLVVASLPPAGRALEWEAIPTPSELSDGSLITTSEGELHWIVMRSTVHRYDEGARRWESVAQDIPNGSVIARHEGDLFLGGAASAHPLIQRLVNGVWVPAENGARRSGSRVLGLAELDGVLYAAANASLVRFDDTTSSWTPVVGPFGSAEQLAADAGLLYVGGDSGLFATPDHGSTWIDARVGIPDDAGQAHSVARYGGELFCAASGIAYRRDASAGRWVRLPTARAMGDVRVVAAEGEIVLLVGTTKPRVYSLLRTLYISRDRGATWEKSTGVDPSGPSFSVAMSDGVIFVGTRSRGGRPGGVVRSDDDGYTWTSANSGLPAESVAITALARTRRVIFLGTDDHGILRSDDEGVTWDTTEPRYSSDITSLLAGGGGPLLATTQFADGVVGSTDGGRTWSRQAAFLGDVRALARHGTATYAIGSGGVWMKPDGRAWRALTEVSANRLVIDGDAAALATWRALLFSRDGGGAWQESRTVFPASSLAGIGGVFYAGVSGTPSSGVMRSTDGGNLWRFAGRGSRGPIVRSLVAYGSTLYAGMDGGLSRSHDGGESWESLTDGLRLGAAEGMLFHEGNLYAYDAFPGHTADHQLFRARVGPPTPRLGKRPTDATLPRARGAASPRTSTHDPRP